MSQIIKIIDKETVEVDGVRYRREEKRMPSLIEFRHDPGIYKIYADGEFIDSWGVYPTRDSNGPAYLCRSIIEILTGALVSADAIHKLYKR